MKPNRQIGIAGTVAAAGVALGAAAFGAFLSRRHDGGGDAGGSTLDKVVSSPVFKHAVRTAAREIVRGMFRTGRR